MNCGHFYFWYIICIGNSTAGEFFITVFGRSHLFSTSQSSQREKCVMRKIGANLPHVFSVSSVRLMFQIVEKIQEVLGTR